MGNLHSEELRVLGLEAKMRLAQFSYQYIGTKL